MGGCFFGFSLPTITLFASFAGENSARWFFFGNTFSHSLLTKNETECKLEKASVCRRPSAERGDGCSVSNGHFFGRRA